MLDYSNLLFFKNEPAVFEFKSETIKVNNIDSFVVKIQTDK